MYEIFWNTIRDWQVLVGAFLGAAVPILFWLFIEIYNNYKQQKEDLYYLEKTLAVSISTVGEVQLIIRNFTDNRLKRLIRHVKESSRAKVYSIDETFFPLFYVHTVSEDINKINTKSAYLDDKISRVSMMSKDFAMIIDNLRSQFTGLVENNRQVIVSKSISPEAQCANYLRNIREFRDVVEKDLYNQDVKSYLKTLVSSRIAVNNYRGLGFFHWKYKFSPSFKYFKDKEAMNTYNDEMFERIDQFFEEKNREEFKKVEKQLSRMAKIPESD
jgi:hypothetical protein